MHPQTSLRYLTLGVCPVLSLPLFFNLNHKKSSRTRSKPILGKKDGNWVWYSGIKQAARELKDISLDSIYKCLKGKTINGYQFKYAPDPDLPGEIWRDIPQEFFKHSVKGWRVSNKGRVHPKKGVKSYGTKVGKYKRFCCLPVLSSCLSEYTFVETFPPYSY